MAILSTPEYLTTTGWYFSCDGAVNEKRSINSIAGMNTEVQAVAGDTMGQSKGIANRQAKPGGFSKFGNITIKVVATTERDLYDWYFKCNPRDGGKSTWTQKNFTATITVVNAANEPTMRFEIQECYPCKYTPFEFGVDSNLALESFELVHNGWVRTQ